MKQDSPAIELAGLTKHFGNHRAVTDLTLQVRAGEVFGFLGPNGAGKSTTIRLIMGFYRPSSGRVSVFGSDPLIEMKTVHREIGYLPGELALFPRMTGREHLQWMARGRGDPTRDFQDELITRFDADLDRPVRTLSKGNRQKIGIILAFGHRPDLLVLDEPTTGLDPLLQDEFDQLVRETVAEGRTVFLSSHELDEVQRTANRVGIIRAGKMIVVDTVEHLREGAPRTVEFRFREPVDCAALTGLDGVELVGVMDACVRLTVTGPITPLLAAAVPLQPIDVTARPADLDELFRRYYRTENSEDLGARR